tara:strand:+ start:77 stop:703 length:627 start_codon:yes stop_codon:yes gene_type:complete
MKTEPIQTIAENVFLYSPDPLIYVVDDFLSPKECQSFIDFSKDKLEDATVINESGSTMHKNRTNKNCFVKHDATEIIHEVSKRFSILTKMSIRSAEDFQLVYYGVGKEYQAHFDSFDPESEAGKLHWNPGGQRVLTVLAYLNDVEEGGETYFPKLDVGVKPIKGRAIVFENCLKDTNIIHPNSLHAGMPVKKGEKWAINLWFREGLRY